MGTRAERPAVRALIVDRDSKGAEEFSKRVRDDFKIDHFDLTNTLMKAVMLQSEESYNMCFISSSFPMEDLANVFIDMKGIGKTDKCLFVYLCSDRDKIPPEEVLTEIGFGTAMTYEPSMKERGGLMKGMASIFENEKYDQLDTTLSLVIDQIDHAAATAKRTGLYKIAQGTKDLIKLGLARYEGLVSSYFESVSDKLFSRIWKRKVEKEELRLDERYNGVSKRVRDKILLKQIRDSKDK